MTIAVMSADWLVPIESPFFALVRSALLGASVYAATFWFGFRDIVQETWALVRNPGTPNGPAALA